MPAKVEKCVKSLLKSRSFYPEKSLEDRQSVAWGTCTNRYKAEKESAYDKDLVRLAQKLDKAGKFKSADKIDQLSHKSILSHLWDGSQAGAGRGKVRVYHGTSEEFDEFDVDKSADGTIWFTTNKAKIDAGEVAAAGKGRIIEREIDESQLKLGDWEDADKYSTGELIRQGYDGLRLVDDDETTYQIFYPEKLGRSCPSGKGT